MCALGGLSSPPTRARASPMRRPSVSIDHSTARVSLACSLSRSFHVAGIAGSCQIGPARRTRRSAIQREYAGRSSSVGMRSVVRFPLMTPPSAMVPRGYGLSGGEADGELRAAFVHVARSDGAAVGGRDRLRDREAEARAVTLRVLAAVEAAEEARLRAAR